MKKKLKRIGLCSFCILSAVFLFSCVPEEDEGIKAEAAGSKVSLDDEEQGKKTLPDKSSKENESVLSVITDPEGRDFLLYRDEAGERIFPEDFKIGLLQNNITADEQTSAIIKTADAFLKSIIDESPDYNLVTSDKRGFIERNILYQLGQQTPKAFRLGLINTAAMPPRAAVRFEIADGYAEGEIYFIMENSWKVFDFHMNFKKVNSEDVPADAVWYPSEKLM